MYCRDGAREQHSRIRDVRASISVHGGQPRASFIDADILRSRGHQALRTMRGHGARIARASAHEIFSLTVSGCEPLPQQAFFFFRRGYGFLHIICAFGQSGEFPAFPCIAYRGAGG